MWLQFLTLMLIVLTPQGSPEAIYGEQGLKMLCDVGRSQVFSDNARAHHELDSSDFMQVAYIFNSQMNAVQMAYIMASPTYHQR